MVGTSATQVSQTERIAILDALTRPVDRDAVAAMKASATRDVKRRLVKQTVDASASTFIIVFVFLTAAVTVSALPFFLASFDPLSLGGIISSLIGATLVAVVGVTLGPWAYHRIRRIWSKRGTWTHRWRMRELALDNRLNYIPTAGNILLAGTVLQNAGRGHWDTFRILGERFGMFGNVLPFGSGGEGQAPHGWGFLAVHLDAHVPHLLLIPRPQLFSFSNTLLNLAGKQKMNLEGDFDKYFQLYAPADYSRDALYVITPDLMALLIDRLPGSYVEAYDNMLVVTTPEPFDFGTPATWERINLLLQTVVPKAVRQTRNYRDARSEVRGKIATAGIRLRLSFPVLAVIGAAWFNFLLMYGLIRYLFL